MVINLYKEILTCFLKREYVVKSPLQDINPNNGEQQLTNDQLYLGINVLKNKNNPDILKDQAKRRDFFDR